MKDPGSLRGHKELARERAARRTRSHQTPVRSHAEGPAELTLCDGCGAVFSHKTWRRSAARTSLALEKGDRWSRCPACVRQVKEPAGTVVLTGDLVESIEQELRRRIQNVCERARFTQPERRLLAVERTPAGLKVTTTSQELAHRIGREIEKAFGGSTSYSWSDSDGHLFALWNGPSPPGARRRP
jgi:NMD protein affecting ribosome stability and mRNA decay